MPSAIQQFFTAQALHLRDGRFRDLVQPYATPLVVLLPDPRLRASILATREAIERFFRAKFDGLRDAGIDYLRAHVDKVKPVSREKAIASVTWYYVAGNGRREGETRADYFLVRSAQGLTVEMIEFRKLAFTAIADWVDQFGNQIRKRRDLH